MNSLKAWLSAEHGRGISLAKAIGVPNSFVSKMAAGLKPIPIAHGAAIEHFTDGAVTRQDMFPDTWQRYWPELAFGNCEQKHPPALDGKALGAIAGGV